MPEHSINLSKTNSRDADLSHRPSRADRDRYLVFLTCESQLRSCQSERSEAEGGNHKGCHPHRLQWKCERSGGWATTRVAPTRGMSGPIFRGIFHEGCHPHHLQWKCERSGGGATTRVAPTTGLSGPIFVAVTECQHNRNAPVLYSGRGLPPTYGGRDTMNPMEERSLRYCHILVSVR